MAPRLSETPAPAPVPALAPWLPDAPAQPVDLEDHETPPDPILAGPASATSCLGLAAEHLTSYRISHLSLNAIISGLSLAPLQELSRGW